MIKGERLKLVRERRGLTKSNLATRLEVSVATISRWEANQQEIPEGRLDAIAHWLDVPSYALTADEYAGFSEEAFLFRAPRSMTATQRKQAAAFADFAFLFMRNLEEVISLPGPDVEPVEDLGPERAAQTLRAAWHPREGAIQHLHTHLERHGIRVLGLPRDFLGFDAYSAWLSDTPFIFVDQLKSAERIRFDLAHELGHLVMHKSTGTVGDRAREAEADRFAAEFLAPAVEVKRSVRRPTLEYLIKLKRQWGISLIALIFRLRKLEVISDFTYRSLVMETSRLGYRTSEPDPMERETSGLFRKVFEVMERHELNHARTSAGVTEQDMYSMSFGHLPTALDGGDADRPSRAAMTSRLSVIQGGPGEA